MQEDSRPDLSIITVNWNSLELTSVALSSLREMTSGISYEVIVIDNATTEDDSATELPIRFPWITFIANRTNVGFSRANNQGMVQATGRYILLLNSDTIQIENALRASVSYMDSHPDVGLLGIRHLNNDVSRTNQKSAFSFPRPWAEILNVVGIRMEDSYRETAAHHTIEADVDWVCGSFMLMRRECFDQVGFLDERFFIYDEDIDWCYRARELGWRIRFWPDASIIHLGSASYPLMRDKTFSHFRSRLTYLSKNHSLILGGLFYLAMCSRLTLATFRQAMRLGLRRGTAEEFLERYRRQKQFVLLRSGRIGC